MSNEVLSLSPLEQLFYLNKELVTHIEDFKSKVIVVGGQAVAYWLNKYKLQIPLDKIEEQKIQSNDIDYVALYKDVKTFADIWDVDDPDLAKVETPPPSMGVIFLKKKDEIKHLEDGRLFLDSDSFFDVQEVKSNLVDIIDLPSGYEHKDFDENSKNFDVYTTTFEFPDELKVTPSERLRVLTPIGCFKSRVSNIFRTDKPKDIEIARLKALGYPIYYYFQDLYLDNNENFRAIKKHLDVFIGILMSNELRLLYADYDCDFRTVLDGIVNLPFIPTQYIEGKEYISKRTKIDMLYERKKQARQK